MKIPLSSPEITDEDINAVTSVLRTSQLSLGPKLLEFEESFAAYIGVAHAVALSSGTAGLQLGLQALGVGEGDEVIVPSFTFIAAANAIRHLGAVPVFADIDPVSLNLTAETVERVLSRRSRAILLVHTFGIPAEMDSIVALAEKNNLRIVEDACEAIGAEYRARKIGSFGDLGVFSFYPNKPITTGEGGIVVTRDARLAKTIRALRNQGRTGNDDRLCYSLVGHNFRLSEMNCALGISQLQRIESILARRKAVADSYYEALLACPTVVPPLRTVVEGRISWFVFVVRLSERFPRTARDQVIEALTRAGIGCRGYFPAIHLQAPYRNYCGKDSGLTVTEEITWRTLALPFFNTLTREQVFEVCGVLAATLEDLSGRLVSGGAITLDAECRVDFL